MAAYDRGGIFYQFYDTQYVNENDNNFPISPPISTYYTSNCLSFKNFPSIYNIIMFKAKWNRQIKCTFI